MTGPRKQQMSSIDILRLAYLGLIYFLIHPRLLANVRKNINFDIKHGVTREGVTAFIDKVLNDPSFSDVRKSEGTEERIKQLQIEKQ